MISFKKINLNTLLIISILVICLLYLRQCSKTYKLKESLNVSENNITALKDSVTYYTFKNNGLVFQKAILIANKKELKSLNNDLYKEIKKLKDNPKVIVKKDIEIRYDTVEVNSEIVQYPNNEFKLRWKHDTLYSLNNYHSIESETSLILDPLTDSIQLASSYITKNEIGISLTTSLVKEEDYYKILVNSDYPGFNVLDINGSIVDKSMITSNESSIVIGPSIGYGLVFSSNGAAYHGIITGFNLTYNLNKQIKGLFKKGLLK
jgi:hypothetical protein